MTALGPLATDLYLPSLPSIGVAFGRDAAAVQLTLSANLVGFAMGQIFHGPLSDRYDRRPVLLIGLVGFVLSAAACAAATSIEAMIIARALQGLSASAPIVLARSVARDLYEGPRAGRELARMAAIMGVVPAIAPTIGGAMAVAWGWRSGFVLQLSLGAILAVAVYLRLPETVPARVTTRFSLMEVLGDFAGLLRHGEYRLHVALQAASYGGLFAFISGSSFVLQGVYHLSAIGFGGAFAFGALSFVSGSMLAQHLAMRIGMARAVALGTLLLAAGGLLAVIGQVVGPGHPAELVIPVMIFMTGIGIVMPLTQASALMPFPEKAGTASSLLGFVQMGFAALVGAAVGQGLAHGAIALVAAMALLGCSAFGLNRLLEARRRRLS